MTLVYHPSVQSDFNDALDYYETEGARLADRFEAEFKAAIAAVVAAPRQFPYYLRSRTYRRIRLRSFRYVIVYREHAGGIRVTVLKSEKRHPRFGIARW